MWWNSGLDIILKAMMVLSVFGIIGLLYMVVQLIMWVITHVRIV
jgi:hypothetical protein